MWAQKKISGWGRYPVVEADCIRPERRSELLAAFEDRGDEPLLAYGLGRSYGDAALLDGGRVVMTRRLDRMLEFDPESGWLRCEAGVSLEQIIHTFLPKGFFPPVVPGTQFVTVGGAIGCNIHGKNHHVDGCFGDHVRSMEILTGKGDIVECSRDVEPELFWATIGGMGLTGLILSVEVQLYRVANPYIEMETVRCENLDEFFVVSEESADFSHTVTWIDCAKRGAGMGRGIMMRGGHAKAGTQHEDGAVMELADHVMRMIDGRPFESNLWLNSATISIFNEVYFRKTPPGTHRTVVGYEPFFFPLDAVNNWNYIYGDRGFLQYQMVVPDNEATREIIDQISASGMGSFLAVIKDFGELDHGGLSFPMKGTTLALDFPNLGTPLLDLMNRLDDVVMSCGGRVYLGKDARLSEANFKTMYPEWEKWKDIRDKWDPDGVFQSDLGRRLGLS